MIRKIKNIDVGVYKEFSWPDDLPSFSEFNLIYGWNYSGKTTLSRVFGVLERPSSLSALGGEFSIETNDGQHVFSSSLEESMNVRVFNRYFLERNFQEEHSARAVYVVGDEANIIRKKIARFKQHKARVDGVSVRLKQERSTWERRVNEGLKRDGARAISELVSERGFNKNGLDQLIATVKDSVDLFILNDDKFDALKITAVSNETFAPQFNYILPNIDMRDLVDRVSTLLAQTASNNAISTLTNNPQLESWVRSGRDLHVDESHCGFCGSQLSETRIEELGDHFSKEYESLVDKINGLIKQLKCLNFEVSLPSSKELIHEVRGRYIKLVEPIDRCVQFASDLVGELVECLHVKVGKIEGVMSIDSSLYKRFDDLEWYSYADFESEIKDIYREHNLKISDIEDTKAEAKKAIKLHSAASFYKDNKIGEEEVVYQKILNKIRLAGVLKESIDERIFEKEKELKRHSVAVEKLNGLISVVLSGSNISAVQLSENEFEFRRGSEVATNLSEGERTAIAFCYFLLTLEESGNSLLDTIVFIDDPISSLDSNHIYSVYALIMERLYSKCSQIYVSTHNSEFFNLLKDDCLNGNRNFKRGCQGYYTHRSCDNRMEPYSQLVVLPDALRKFKSEYQFLFSMLHNFSNSVDPTLHEAYSAPTLVRKFLVSYLGFRRPGSGSWGSKLNILIDDEASRCEIDKFTNDASHLQGLNRGLQYADYVSSSQAVVTKVLKALQTKDEDHYKSLVQLV